MVKMLDIFFIEPRKLEVFIMQKKNKFDWKIALKKLGINVLIVIFAGLATVYGDNPVYLAMIPLIKAIENWYKHK